MNDMTPYRIIGWCLLGFVLIASVLVYGSWHSDIVEAKANLYEKCVRARYHMTPSGYYAVQGTWPDCQ